MPGKTNQTVLSLFPNRYHVVFKDRSDCYVADLSSLTPALTANILSILDSNTDSYSLDGKNWHDIESWFDGLITPS